jgi:hypothetical protein
MKFLIMHYPPVFCYLGSLTFLSNLYSNIFNQCFSLSVRDHVSYSCRTIGKIVILCFNIYIFGKKTGKQEVVHSCTIKCEV